MNTLPDALPGLDDLDVTLHEPVAKENDMNEARASERADLVELRMLMKAATKLPWKGLHQKLRAQFSTVVTEVQCAQGNAVVGWSGFDSAHYNKQKAQKANMRFIVAACNAIPGLIAEVERLTHEEEVSSVAIDMQATILSEIAVLLKGPEAPLHRHSWHDLADVLRERLQGLSAAGAEQVERFIAEHDRMYPSTIMREADAIKLIGTVSPLASTPPQQEPAPSVAEPAKCETCGGKRKIGDLYDIDTGEQPCPDCTPASAEQVKCVCRLDSNPVCGAEPRSINGWWCQKCKHHRNCHAAAEVKP